MEYMQGAGMHKVSVCLFQIHNPHIDWRARQLRWNSSTICSQCMASNGLKRYRTPPSTLKVYGKKYRTPPSTLEVYGKREFEVDAVLGARKEGKESFLQVHLGPTWEPIENLKIDENFLKNPKKKIRPSLLIEGT